MISTFLLTAILVNQSNEPVPDVRVLQEVSMGQFVNTCTITRTPRPDKGLVWEEKSVDDQKSSWTYRSEYDRNGNFVIASAEFKNPKESLWQLYSEDGAISLITAKYNGETLNQREQYEFNSEDMGNKAMLWWYTQLPTKSETVASAQFVPLNGLFRIKTTYEGDETLTIKGKTYETHRIKRELGIRTEIWWLDNKGLPVQRHFTMEGSSKPHRIDTIKS
ncbi:hypothetical protein CCB80_10735 [Armatimonadetes bacterium Uphvl-Ar1]|nr:hypothetical protein CCB80_10735 [Armatimonadetes bacterium Uphvl-Ar1]